jgi:hypothetical protein
MRSDKNLAIKLRRNGKSYSQISESLNVPKSTLSSWLKDIIITQKAQDKIQSRVNSTSKAKLIERNKNQTKLAKERHHKIYELAKEEAKKLLSDSLFIIGLALYWGEGYKQGAYGSKWKSIDFANSDPDMIEVMVLFFTKFFNIKRSDIKIQLMLHDPKDIEKAVNFWHKTTKIPKNNFIKTCHSVSSASSNKQNRKLEHGTIHLRINDVEKFFRLIGWIDGLKYKIL